MIIALGMTNPSRFFARAVVVIGLFKTEPVHQKYPWRGLVGCYSSPVPKCWQGLKKPSLPETGGGSSSDGNPDRIKRIFWFSRRIPGWSAPTTFS
jgi:hypothetical protein